MKTIALTNAKGGVGKTAIASHLAVHAVGLGLRVWLLDCDPQRSLTKLWALRPNAENPEVFSGSSDPGDAVVGLANGGFGPADLLVIDTGPVGLEHIKAAIRAADLAIVPMQVSQVDLDAARPVLRMAYHGGKPFRVVFTFTTPKTPGTQELRDLLVDEGFPVSASQFSWNETVRLATFHGLTGIDAEDKKAVKETAQLWAEVAPLIGLPVKKKARRS